ncbi:unnamed protein product [Clonostachys rosea f. rosea IK726]|uniref:HTH araC/xylS-type domain-containing protein n=2 Tax=Bionectria ochroleuca TaxID=29856 RepID=A0A0B7JMU9_BIOOC|nr:unnamed protein product [Clonostachys rosea f. rosea IK726]
MEASPVMSFFDDDESRWNALQTRNPVSDGFFVYGVRSTKIYCRPICKARLARRANRCKPEVEGLMPEERAVRRIRAFVRDGGESKSCRAGKAGARLSLGQMAKEVGLSKWHFHRVFKRCVGMTPVEYVKRQRLAASSRECPAVDMVPEDTTVDPEPVTPSSGMDDFSWFNESLFTGNLGELSDIGSSSASGSTSGPGSVVALPQDDTLALLNEECLWTDFLQWPEDGLIQTP